MVLPLAPPFSRLGKGSTAASPRVGPAVRARRVMVVGLDDLGETPAAGEGASRRPLPKVPERHPAARPRSPALLVAAAVGELSGSLAHLLRN